VVNEYLAIEEIRFGPRLRVLFNVSDETLVCKVPRFILQPLVENAIRHGVSHLPDGGTVSVRAAIERGKLTLQIVNDVEAKQILIQDRPGLGLANTRQRISQIYGPEATMIVREDTKAFTVTMTLPCEVSREASGELL